MTSAAQQHITQQQLDQSHSPSGIFTLPCGFMDDEGNFHTEAEIREITGVEEDILLGKGGSGFQRLNSVLTNCVVRIGTINDPRKLASVVTRLRTADRTFLLIQLRRVSLGDRYPFEFKCPSCREKSVLELDLSELETQPTKDPERETFDFSTPSGKKLVVKAMNGVVEAELDRQVRKRNDDQMTALLLARIESIDGKEGKGLKPILKSFTSRDRNAIRSFFDEIDGGVETDVEVECPSCGEEEEVGVRPTDSGFFFPSSVRKPSKTRSST